jgi:hypothetical protein
VITSGKRLPRWARRSLITLGVLLLVPVLALTVIMTWLWSEDAGTPTARSTGADAMWLGHAWVDGRRGQSDVNELAAKVKAAGIRDLFVHSGPLEADGSLNAALRPNVKWLTNALRQAAPGVRVQAWLGTVVGDGRLDPEDGATRDRMVISAGQVLDDGFAGVHYDLEPMADGTPGFLRLLETTHELTRSRNAVLSVAAHQLEPLPGLRIPGRLVMRKSHWWSADYLRAVAERVDQVAIMAYDSGMPFESTYSGYVRVQTRRALTAVPDQVTLFMGIPAYHTEGLAHTNAETVTASLRGIRLALNDQPPAQPFGVAVYVDFDATADDWAAYFADWAP